MHFRIKLQACRCLRGLGPTECFTILHVQKFVAMMRSLTLSKTRVGPKIVCKSTSKHVQPSPVTPVQPFELDRRGAMLMVASLIGMSNSSLPAFADEVNNVLNNFVFTRASNYRSKREMGSDSLTRPIERETIGLRCDIDRHLPRPAMRFEASTDPRLSLVSLRSVALPPGKSRPNSRPSLASRPLPHRTAAMAATPTRSPSTASITPPTGRPV